ncbi:hypothetical protein AMES_7209 [Amycolatopsis mediterranei S699]|uniref:ArsR family transcriptional regulator n=2 Tax=Amycolatopsis mediterranei TaxID=33910 RepID=A0A0H3DDL9_AMYMU|nr:hypothetical protein [Amycolatopsis mediterranei]ADJ49035.1 hypothetical protein AMED_7320 [Amycolatopsis mediterranei U32]AEK45991.1 hypothetical protein RAM_37620 [Amycolatopsis mediterranei S699]AFO80742.1 hypothetical protein AMES_7209 [Amycolatopsis mediterranei S699]AGT87870.1 hypothetical protein B737_7209 [Amycolatopsis mediterranei RB]KDU93843.1 hypothetical protein DV36_00445 [Amycolatopsis mediterranei]
METDELGRLLFGRPCRLKLALWILDHPQRRFYQSEPPSDVIAQSAVGVELRRLASLGMLTESSGKERRRIYYDRTDSSLWSIIEAARRSLER